MSKLAKPKKRDERVKARLDRAEASADNRKRTGISPNGVTMPGSQNPKKNGRG